MFLKPIESYTRNQHEFRGMLFIAAFFIIFSASVLPAQEYLLLENMVNDTTKTFKAVNSITAGPNFLITDSGRVTFMAGDKITLRPGFAVEHGGEFFAVMGEVSVSAIESPTTAPLEFKLRQNFPNPFNPSTSIEFTIPGAEFVELIVYNLLGEKVNTIVSKQLSAGKYIYQFDGKELASGIYYYRLTAGELQQTKRMLLLK